MVEIAKLVQTLSKTTMAETYNDAISWETCTQPLFLHTATSTAISPHRHPLGPFGSKRHHSASNHNPKMCSCATALHPPGLWAVSFNMPWAFYFLFTSTQPGSGDISWSAWKRRWPIFCLEMLFCHPASQKQSFPSHQRAGSAAQNLRFFRLGNQFLPRRPLCQGRRRGNHFKLHT